MEFQSVESSSSDGLQRDFRDRTDCGTQGCQRKCSQQDISNRSMKGKRAAAVLDISENGNMRRKDMGRTIAPRPSGPAGLRSL